jgi:tetratricopeptide (TPR) repeat protein
VLTTARWVPLILVCLVVTVVQAQPAIQAFPLQDGGVGRIDWSIGGAILADGVGCVAASAADQPSARVTARRAATVVAQRRLLEVTQVLGIFGGIAMGDAMRASDGVRRSVEGVLRGATVVESSERWIDDRCMELTMAVALADLRHAVPQLPYAAHIAPPTLVAFDDEASVRHGGSVRVTVLDNDVGWDLHPTTLRTMRQPEHGTVRLDGEGGLTYQHDGGEATVDSFVYAVIEGGSVSTEAVVAITIVPPLPASALGEVGRRPEEAEDPPTSNNDQGAAEVDEPGRDVPGAIHDRDGLLHQARMAQRTALDRASVASPDDPLWRAAIADAQRAADAADEPEAALVLARTLSLVGWHSRAFAAWQGYLGATKELPAGADGPDTEPPSAALFTRTAAALGFARFQVGDELGALSYYRAILEVLPDDVDALTWSARLLFDLGRSEEAFRYWAHVTTIVPDDGVARQFLERTRQRIAVGVAASDAFHAGASAYEAGHVDVALAHFEAAIRENEAFIDAWVWAGRTSMELGLPDRSRDHWDAVLARDPRDERARYFRDRADAQVRWGIPAADAFHAGQVARQRGQLREAAEHFVAATLMNDGYLAAWEWAAHTHQELGAYAEALVYWQALLARDADYERAAYHRNVVLQLVGRSRDAGQALADAITAYQSADFETAEVHIHEAIRADPAYPEAWAWLGLLHFVLASYEDAALGYEHALALEPTNDDYRYFMEEARWRAANQL